MSDGRCITTPAEHREATTLVLTHDRQTKTVCRVPRRRTPLPAWILTACVTLGHRIATLRRDRGYSQDDLAELTGLDRRTIQRYENAVSAPGFAELLLIARALDVHVTDLLG
ncbi:helix-turn-helix domain-containing protein [Streptomyces sp. NPDC019443]|uniref:helix-turn-helix domain-containing protein n=1 Tax=Streptomyces sp. NPDC019443 TaxID=3365061 RepID=UPI0037988E7E